MSGSPQRGTCPVTSVADWATERKLPRPASNCFETGRGHKLNLLFKTTRWSETANGCLVLHRKRNHCREARTRADEPEGFLSRAPPKRVRRAFALLTRTYHGCRHLVCPLLLSKKNSYSHTIELGGAYRWDR